MALHTLQADTMLREYRLIKLLGEGGFGLTYLAFDTHLEKYVAIKEYMPAEHAVREADSKIAPRSSASQKTYNWGLNAFINEAKTLAKFEHPSIVRIYRFFEENGTAYIVMEYCEGGCLIDIISNDKPMDENQLKEIITSIVDGLQLVHKQGILHRDIKPDNIMFRKDGTAVLIDFGAARQAIGDKSRKVTTIITPGYAPLEQYSSKGEIGPWSDIYSLAAVAYLGVTGKKPPDIMNRLHDDNIEKLSERINSSSFLKAIDCGLMLEVSDRPKNLSDWSSLWSKTNNFNTTLQTEPIVAKKEISSETHLFKPQVISARPNISTRDQTTLNTHTIDQLAKKNGFGFFSWFLLLMLIAIATYITYEHTVNNKEFDQLFTVDAVINKWNLFFRAKTDNTIIQTQSKETQKQVKNEGILIAQQKLKLLGYKVAQNGILDIRTQQSIKKFEQDNQLVVTGVVDEILIDELTRKYESIEQENWRQALLSNTQEEYQNYTNQYPNNTHQKEIEIKLMQITKQKANALEKQQQETILQSKIKQKQRLISVTQEKKKLIKSIQAQLIRLKYKDLNQTGNLDLQTKSLIKTYQKLKNLPVNGLPTNTLLFKLKSETKWPGKNIGETFKACKNCPQMVVIKAANFTMGNATGLSTQKPAHSVYIKEFSLSQLPVNYQQWDACYADGFCTYQPNDKDDKREHNPVTNISYQDSLEFINWLKSLSGQNYQLPSEAQWEYAAQSTRKGNPYRLMNPKNSLTELIADCWHPNYLDAPTDGSPRVMGLCEETVTRTTLVTEDNLSVYKRAKINKTERNNTLGFRVAVIHD